MADKLLAYSVQEEGEGTGGIIFAKHAVVARRVGANEYADGDFSYVRCHRAPWADHCAETGAVPVALMIEHGWWFECMGCGRRIGDDLYDYDDDDRYANWKTSDVIGTQHGYVFCDQRCSDEHDAFEAERKRRADRTSQRFSAIILRRFPDAEIIRDQPWRPHVYVTRRNDRWSVEQVVVAFNFPGMKHGPAQLRYDRQFGRRRDKPHYTCCAGDQATFEAWASEQKARARSLSGEG